MFISARTSLFWSPWLAGGPLAVAGDVGAVWPGDALRSASARLVLRRTSETATKLLHLVARLSPTARRNEASPSDDSRTTCIDACQCRSVSRAPTRSETRSERPLSTRESLFCLPGHASLRPRAPRPPYAGLSQTPTHLSQRIFASKPPSAGARSPLGVLLASVSTGPSSTLPQFNPLHHTDPTRRASIRTPIGSDVAWGGPLCRAVGVRKSLLSREENDESHRVTVLRGLGGGVWLVLVTMPKPAFAVRLPPVTTTVGSTVGITIPTARAYDLSLGVFYSSR